ARPVAAVVDDLGTGPAGLAPDTAAIRLAEAGPNRLPAPPRPHPIRRFLRQFDNVLILVLLAAAVITLLLGHIADTAVIVAVVMLNAVIGFVQEGKAERALETIRHMLAPKAAVLRGDRRLTLPAEELVPGDVVLLEAGERVPADLRLTQVAGLQVDESALTGESVPVAKTTDEVAVEAPLGDRTGMAFSGTMVTYGHGRGVVVATGAMTEIGRISGLLATVGKMETPLLRQMNAFARKLTVAVLAIAALVFAVGAGLRGMPAAEAFMAVVGIAVAAIPEGLPAILTVTLAIGVQGMARRRAIVRRLPAIETLGAVSVICSDKTGTLTRNEMTVASVATARTLFGVTGRGYDVEGGFTVAGDPADLAEHPLLARMARAAVLCSEATVGPGADGTLAVEGDPMEGALLVMACKAGLVPEDLRRSEPRTDAIPFDSAHAFMATLHHDHEGHGEILVKGAPERVIAMCTAQQGRAGEEPLDPDWWHAQAEAIAAEGQRVLAVAARPTVADHTALAFGDVEGGLVLLGLFGLIDPPRAEAIEAVAACRSAGIRVKMITGDHAGTAAAVARSLKLENPDGVMTGAELEALDDAALADRIDAVDVFARTSPAHKLRLVEALQARGRTVAMTGDGVNDAPALKRADVGVAMGGRGSEAAKEAAEIVLTDDDFSTLAEAVRAGRTVYDNLKKAIVFLLPVNGGESLGLIIAILAGLTLPVTPIQILWVNMVSSVALAMALAFEPAEPNVMRRPPRPADEPILSRFLVWRIAFVSVLFLAGLFGQFAYGLARGLPVEEARTLAVNTLVVMEIFYLFSVRYLGGPSLTLRGALGTPAVLIAVGAVVALQFLFTYAPFMATVFDTRPLGLVDGALAVGTGLALLIVLEVEKRIAAALRGHTEPHGRAAR
ncbi:MAG: HAD-IC family P-type ATPase, partial [Alphaproteobacteria bacterium]|nr:HAD-IC family P-type ATPase [Alphaproteobacteria bacterium]